jgi:hypothetical protein
MQYIVIVGNPVEGLKFIGPFDNANDVLEWVEDHGGSSQWWLADMEMPS